MAIYETGRGAEADDEIEVDSFSQFLSWVSRPRVVGPRISSDPADVGLNR